MRVGNQYIIHFKGLREGKHDFNFQIGEAFFDENPTLDVGGGNIDVKITLEKHSRFLELQVSMFGEISIQCDRCLENFNYPLDYKGQLYVKFKEEPEEPDENVIFLLPSDDELELNQYFFDCIGLSIPIQKFHPEDENGDYTCNDEMLNILNKHSTEKEQREQDHDTIDPRWSKLKELLNDNKQK